VQAQAVALNIKTARYTQTLPLISALRLLRLPVVGDNQRRFRVILRVADLKADAGDAGQIDVFATTKIKKKRSPGDADG